MIEYADLIGVPFKYGGRNKAVALDCYGLIMELAERAGRKLPVKGYAEDLIKIHMLMTSELQTNKNWRPCEPKEGAIALFKVKDFTAHVGFMLDDETFVHTWENSGGVCTERLSNGWDKRLLGSYEYAVCDE